MSPATEDFPDAPGSRRRLEEALAAHRAGESARAERLYRQLLKRHPSAPILLHQLGLLLHQTGRFSEARAALAEAERIAPERTILLLNHARILARQGRTGEAAQRFRHLHALQPDSGEIAREFALALADSGDWRSAEALLSGWVADHPADHAAQLTLGDLYLQAGGFTEAVESWRAAQQADGDVSDSALHRIGNLQLRLGRGEDAWTTFTEAAARNRRAPWVHCGLAAAAAAVGDFAVMRREAEAAVAVDELSYTAWYQLTMTPEGCTDETAARLRRAIDKTGADPGFWLLHMALGRTLDRLGLRDEGFAAFAQAHALKSRLPPQYRRGGVAAECAQIRSALGKTFLANAGAQHPARVRPIFIVGMPRSGTTLVESILGAHPDVAAGGERRLLDEWLARHGGAAAVADPPGWIRDAAPATLAALREAWERNAATAPGAAAMTDKLPENFLYLGPLAAALPNAAIVHVSRDPRDTCVSCFTTALSGTRAADLATLEDLGRFYREYERLMDFWRDTLDPGRILEVRYETLVREPESTIRRLLEALRLPWHPQCLSFHEAPQSVSTASVYQVRRPINTDSLGQWRRFAAHLGPLLAVLGEALPEEH